MKREAKREQEEDFRGSVQSSPFPFTGIYLYVRGDGCKVKNCET